MKVNNVRINERYTHQIIIMPPTQAALIHCTERNRASTETGFSMGHLLELCRRRRRLGIYDIAIGSGGSRSREEGLEGGGNCGGEMCALCCRHNIAGEV
jgi:hypothetical protein